MQENHVSEEQLEQVFHFQNGTFDLLDAPGDSKKEKTLNAYTLTGLGKYLSSTDRNFDDATPAAERPTENLYPHRGACAGRAKGYCSIGRLWGPGLQLPRPCTHKSRLVSSGWSMSALPPKADIRQRIEHVGFVPKPD